MLELSRVRVRQCWEHSVLQTPALVLLAVDIHCIWFDKFIYTFNMSYVLVIRVFYAYFQGSFQAVFCASGTF